MKPVSQLVSLAASAAAILCSLTGCSSSTGAPAAHDTPTATATATADAAPDPKLDMPTVGECRALRAKDLAPAANATPPTDCSEPHTAITYAVGLLPASVDLVNMPHRRVSKVVSKRCGTGFRTAVGVEDVQLTTIQYAYFVPTKSEIFWPSCTIFCSWLFNSLVAGSMTMYSSSTPSVKVL